MFLHFGHPQPMKVAGCVNNNSLVISQAEGNIRLVTGFQHPAPVPFLGLDIDPSDPGP